MEFSVRRGAVIFGLFLLMAVTETSGRPANQHQNRGRRGRENKTRQDRNKLFFKCTPLVSVVSNYTKALNSSVENRIGNNTSIWEKEFENHIPKKLRCSSQTKCTKAMSKRLVYLHQCFLNLSNSGKGRPAMQLALSHVVKSLKDFLISYTNQTEEHNCTLKVNNKDEADEYAEFYSEKLLDNLKNFGCREEKQQRMKKSKSKERKNNKGEQESTKRRKGKGKRQKKSHQSSASRV